MSLCYKCGDKIEFKPHPVSGKLSPFSMDGEIHFAKCKNEKPKNELSRLDERSCHCGSPGKFLYWRKIASNQDRLWLTFDCHHLGQAVAITEGNKLLVNTTEKEFLETKVRTKRDPWGAFAIRLKEVSSR